MRKKGKSVSVTWKKNLSRRRCSSILSGRKEGRFIGSGVPFHSTVTYDPEVIIFHIARIRNNLFECSQFSIRIIQVYQLAHETVILLLECNPDVGPVLDWVVDRCYTAEPQVADGCFLALAVIFSARCENFLKINYWHCITRFSF